MTKIVIILREKYKINKKKKSRLKSKLLKCPKVSNLAQILNRLTQINYIDNNDGNHDW